MTDQPTSSSAPLQNPAWQPMIDGMAVLASAIQALAQLCERLIDLLQELQRMVAAAVE